MPFPFCPRLTATLIAATNMIAGVSLAAPAPDYELLYAEEFDGTQVNERDWSFRTGPRTGLGIDALNLAKNVRVEGGQLIITAQREAVDGVPANTGGGLISRHRFGYGYYECRSRPFMAGRGVHTAFWQRGLGGEENNSIFEIDSHEIDSTQKIACNNLYVDVSSKGFMDQAWPHRAQVPLQLPPDGWWVDAYEYTPEGVIFYDHGTEVARADFPDLTAQQNVWLTALNGVGPVDADQLPGETRFDYFRYYARDFPGANLLGNGGFEYNQDKFDLQRPVAWRTSGDLTASQVVRGDAAVGDFKLRHASTHPYRVVNDQTLELIRNGEYELRARVRRQGQHKTALLRVSDLGGEDLVVDLPPSRDWTEIKVDRIQVTRHTATLSIISEGKAGDWLELDEVQFMKPPAPGQSPRPSRSLMYREGDPIWQIAQPTPITFLGDDKFYFFGRNCGLGEAISVAFVARPTSEEPSIPIARQPKSGTQGWAVALGRNGDVLFRIGSQAAYRDIVAPAVWQKNTSVHVTCVFDHGTASISINGVLRQRVEGITHSPTDTSAPGRLGANRALYDAVGEVTLSASSGAQTSAHPFPNFAGEIRDLRIYNRALGSEEIVRLGSASH